jgi:hypothetical protein
MFKDTYFEVEGDSADSLLKQVNAVSDLSDFSSKTARLLTHPLSFAPGFHFLKIIDHHQNPLKMLHVIYKNKETIILDGTHAPFDFLAENKHLLLTPETIKNYVRFYFSYVKTPKGSFFIVDSPDNIPWVEEPTSAARRAIFKMMQPLELIDTDEEGVFHLKSSIFYKNSLFESDLTVDQSGKITLLNQELLVDDLPAVANI